VYVHTPYTIIKNMTASYAKRAVRKKTYRGGRGVELLLKKRKEVIQGKRGIGGGSHCTGKGDGHLKKKFLKEE